MAVEALCPTCGAVFNLSDDYVGKKVRCKKCEHVFTVAGEKPRHRADDQGVQSDRGAIAPKKSSRDEDDERTSRKAVAKRGRDDDGEGERPRKRPTRGRDDDDDDDRGRASTRKRVYHDDDDDEDDNLRGPRRKSSGGSGKVFAIVGGIVAVLLLVCGGGIYGFVRLMASAEEALEDQMAQGVDANGNPIQMGFDANGRPIIVGDMGGGFIGPGRQPKDLAEALTFLKGNDKGDRLGAANWLGRQQPDAVRQKEVAQALEPMLKETDEASAGASARALRVWGTQDNCAAVAAGLRLRNTEGVTYDAAKEMMVTIGHFKYAPGSDAVTRFLPNFFVGNDAQQALEQLGPGAEKEVAKYFNYPDKLPGGARDRARGLILRYKTKPAVLLDQAVEDLAAPDQERAKTAAEWLSWPASDEALQLANAEPARRTAVAAGLNRLIDPPPTFFEDTILTTVKRWGTKDNVASLVHLLTTTPFKKRETADALIAIGPACEAQVKPLVNHADGGVANEAKRIITAVGSAESKLDAILADLQSNDGRRIGQAARTLQTTPVDEKQRAKVVSALVEALSNTGPGHTDRECAYDVARALTVWATKDDGGAIAEKVRIMNNFFAPQARVTLIEWMGKEKAEKAIPFLAGALANRDDSQKASKALQAMGPELGEKIEAEVLNVRATGDHLVECIKVLGAVGTKKSLDLLSKQRASALKQQNIAVAQACADAVDAIKARGK